MNVAKMIAAAGSGLAQRPIATNCEAPANTVALMRPISKIDRSRSAARAPQTSPIGIAATQIGAIAIAPSRNCRQTLSSSGMVLFRHLDMNSSGHAPRDTDDPAYGNPA